MFLGKSYITWLMRLFLIQFIFLAFPHLAFADCMACTESFGATVTLKDGSTVDGYLTWNHYRLIDLIGESPPHPIRPYHADLAVEFKQHNKPPYQPTDELFHHWIQFMNRTYQQNPEDQQPRDGLIVFTDLQEIPVPPLGEFCVAVEGTIKRLDAQEIQKIDVNPDLTLRANTTGLDSLPRNQIELLQTETPSFVVEHEMQGCAEVFVVYGNQVSMLQVIQHIVYHTGFAPWGILGDIFINGRKVREASFWDNPNPTQSEQDLIRFVAKFDSLSHLRKEMLTEYRKASKPLFLRRIALRDMKNNESQRKELNEEIERMRLEYISNDTQLVSSVASSLGAPEDFFDLGIIVFHYAWD